MVDIVVVSTSPERDEMMQTPGKLVAGMSIDCLEQAKDDPDIHGENVQVFGESTEGDRDSDATKGENHGLKGRRILCGQAERCAVLMVELMDELVQSGLMQCAVKPVMPGIFKNEEQSDLPYHGDPRREGNRCGETEILSHGVEEPDLR